jgi:hypothetical protein
MVAQWDPVYPRVWAASQEWCLSSSCLGNQLHSVTSSAPPPLQTLCPPFHIPSIAFFLLSTTTLFSVLQFASNFWCVCVWGGGGGLIRITHPLGFVLWLGVLPCSEVFMSLLFYCAFSVNGRATQTSTHLAKVLKKDSIRRQVVKYIQEVMINLCFKLWAT